MFRHFTKPFRPLSTTALNNAKYGGRYTSVLIPGDGIGPELSTHLQETFRIIQAPIDFEVIQMSSKDGYDEKQISQVIKAIQRSGAGIKGNIHTKKTALYTPKNLRIRTELDLFANVIHAKSFAGVETRHKDIDIVLVRENTEGEYAGKEHEICYHDYRIVQSLKIMSKEKCLNIANFAFKHAIKNGRKKVTCIHKANIMKKGDGLFLETCRQVAKEYPEIQFDDMIVDNTCMQLVQNPWQFDVLLAPNLYGNIIGNILCGISGGPGLTPGANYGNNLAVFEMATRSTGEGIMNKNIANPCAFLSAGVNLLKYFDLNYHANIIENAIDYTLSDQQIHTPDLGGDFGTSDIIKSVTDHIRTHVQNRNMMTEGNEWMSKR